MLSDEQMSNRLRFSPIKQRANEQQGECLAQANVQVGGLQNVSYIFWGGPGPPQKSNLDP